MADVLTPQPPRTPLVTNQAPIKPGSIGQQAMTAFGPYRGAKADCIYGATGVTKTSRLGDAAEYIKKKHNKDSRLVSADPGGWDTIASLIKSSENSKGIITAFPLVRDRINYYEVLEKLCLGWWPKHPNDPQSEMLPPSQNGLKDIGGVFYEGLTSIAEALMHTNLTDMENINVPRSDAERSNIIKSGSFKQRFASQTDYGSIQTIIAARVANSGMLPVEKVIWTALEQTGEDEQKKPIYGPDIIGKKATGQCGPWFGNLLHLDFINIQVEVPDPLNPSKKLTVEQPKPFIFLRNHIDPADPFKRPWPAKTRAARTKFEKVPNIFEPRLDKLYELLDKLQAEELADKAAAK